MFEGIFWVVVVVFLVYWIQNLQIAVAQNTAIDCIKKLNINPPRYQNGVYTQYELDDMIKQTAEYTRSQILAIFEEE